ncbi:hypothetical protein BSL78_28287 [Apostichopus japonicus]|uniref:Uncharacterized protein n=1 Tax=Stichopus japonicus TaxID=307972 RepID=A0A2G8JGM0_STIJA|nr:hypothetical protein BSL78_28287 [Apostichopus japonicus]
MKTEEGERRTIKKERRTRRRVRGEEETRSVRYQRRRLCRRRRDGLQEDKPANVMDVNWQSLMEDYQPPPRPERTSASDIMKKFTPV